MKALRLRALRVALSIAAAAIVCPIPAWTADVPRVELFGGYSYASGSGDQPQLEPSRNLQGFEASLTWNLGRHLGMVADASGHFGDLDGVDLTRWFLLAGPRVSFPGERIGFFVHVLAGAVRTKESLTVLDIRLSESTTNFGGAAGGGIDVRLSDHWAVRLQGDLALTKFEGETSTDPRSAAGLVFRAGTKH
jgi:opacity protein-like surface antigen